MKPDVQIKSDLLFENADTRLSVCSVSLWLRHGHDGFGQQYPHSMAYTSHQPLYPQQQVRKQPTGGRSYSTAHLTQLSPLRSNTS